MQTFVAALDTLFGGFRARAEGTFALLQADGTAFLVVAAPEPDALREAAYFVERLGEDRMPLAGLVVNRASPRPETALSADEAMAAAGPAAQVREPGRRVTAGLLRLHADRMRLVERESQLRRRFAAAHPEVPTAVVPALATDVHDLVGLRRVGRAAGGTLTRRRAPRTRSERRGNGPWSLRAVSSTSRHDALGRRRSSARRSRSVMPPHTPHSIWLSSASARHSVRTGQPLHSCLALFCSAPRTNSSSGCASSARGRRRPVFNPHDVPTSISARRLSP